jgi:phage I-like protein
MERQLTLTWKGQELPEWIRVLPLGRVELADERPPFEVDQESLGALVAAFQSRGVDLVVDYEHQSLTGERAPAAGWIKELRAEADGLWARVEWTPQAQEYLRNREYRYFSPVLKLDPESRKPVALLQVALTNVPAMKSLEPLVARYGWEAAREELAARLELQGEARDEELWLTARRVWGELVALTGLGPEATVTELRTEIAALKAARSQVAALEAEVVTLREQVQEAAVSWEVEEALRAGKITPAQESWALEYCRRDLEGFRAFVAAQPKVVPLHERFTLSRGEKPPTAGLRPEELAVCRALNIAPEDYMKARETGDGKKS